MRKMICRSDCDIGLLPPQNPVKKGVILTACPACACQSPCTPHRRPVLSLDSFPMCVVQGPIFPNAEDEASSTRRPLDGTWMENCTNCRRPAPAQKGEKGISEPCPTHLILISGSQVQVILHPWRRQPRHPAIAESSAAGCFDFQDIYRIAARAGGSSMAPFVSFSGLGIWEQR